MLAGTKDLDGSLRRSIEMKPNVWHKVASSRHLLFQANDEIMVDSQGRLFHRRVTLYRPDEMEDWLEGVSLELPATTGDISDSLAVILSPESKVHRQ